MSFLIRLLVIAATAFVTSTATAADPWLTFPGGDGPGRGKHIVLISGDEEYRSEEMLPQMAKILSKHHGFRCTVLFAIDPKDGTIQPNVNNNIPGLEKLKDADLLILFTRFRNLPDDQMKHFVEYIESGKPIIGLRTATHAFNISGGAYKKYTWGNKDKDFDGGFGRHVLGETWVAHHGSHGKEGTRGIAAKGEEKNVILKGIDAGSIFGTTDVYTAKPPADCKVVVYGEVTETLKPDSKAVVAAGLPVRFALDTASGPVSASSSSAILFAGMRRATVPRVSPRSHVSELRAGRMTVRPPGQKAATSARTSTGTDSASASRVGMPGTSTGGGALRPRPLAASSRVTASG